MAKGLALGMGHGDYIDKRLVVVKLVFLIGLILVLVRLFQLQVLLHDWYEKQAAGQHDVLSELTPIRGEIFAKDNLAVDGLAPVVINKDSQLFYAVPAEITAPETVADKLALLLDIDKEELLAKVSKVDDPYEPIQEFIDDSLAEEIKALNLPGIHFTPQLQRYYVPLDGMGQALGFLGYDGSLRVGQYGVEGAWQRELGGKLGYLKAEKDVAGSLIALGKRDIVRAEDGADLILTIDINIETQACGALTEAVKRHGADSGSLIIMNPATGAILALCNAPSFDPNNYREASDIGVFSNPVVSAAYEPGSVFKPITMAAGLQYNKLTPDTTYEDEGQVKIGPDILKNSDLEAHGTQTMTAVLENSLNTGAIFAMRQAGADNFKKIVEDFGFGEISGIALPAEARGNIKSIYGGKEIYLATASFGQGITTTPLQLLAAYGAIANQGRLARPYIVDEVIYADGNKKKTETQEVRQVLSPATARTLAGMMVQVVEGTHGRRAAVPGYYVAGKTGTAQVALKDRAGYDPHITIGTFIGFAPVDNARFVMLVKIDNPKDVKFAESTAAPVFGQVAKFLLNYLEVPPERDVK